MAVFGTVPSSTNAYTQGVRKSLVGKGIGNERITSGPSGVMVDNKPFIKPERVYGGTSFTSPQAFNNAWQQYSKSLQQPTQTGFQPTGATAGVAIGMPAIGMQQQPTPTAAPPQTGYNQQIQDIISQITKQATAPQQFTDVRQSPEYAAYAAQSARRQQEGIRAAQEALGSAGFGRSTTLGESAGRVAGQEQQYLESQVIPQLMAQQAAQKQQQFQNIIASLQPLQQQQQFAEQTEQERAALTGAPFLPPEARAVVNQIMGLKQQAESPTITREQRAGLSQQADVLRGQLQDLGVSPEALGAGVTAKQAAAAPPGTPTMARTEADRAAAVQQQQTAYQQSRDKISDERYKQQFDEDARRFGLEFATNEAYRAKQLSQDDARIALQRAQESRIALGQEEESSRAWLGLESKLAEQGQPKQPEQPKPTFTPAQAISQIKDRYTTTKLNKKVYTPPSPEQIFKDVSDYGYTEKQENDIMKALGLTDKQIQDIDDQLPK